MAVLLRPVQFFSLDVFPWCSAATLEEVVHHCAADMSSGLVEVAGDGGNGGAGVPSSE